MQLFFPLCSLTCLECNRHSIAGLLCAECALSSQMFQMMSPHNVTMSRISKTKVRNLRRASQSPHVASSLPPRTLRFFGHKETLRGREVMHMCVRVSCEHSAMCSGSVVHRCRLCNACAPPPLQPRAMVQTRINFLAAAYPGIGALAIGGGVGNSGTIGTEVVNDFCPDGYAVCRLCVR